MKVAQITAFESQRVGSDRIYGGLGRFLEEIVVPMRAMGVDVITIDVNQAALVAATQAAIHKEWDKLADIGHEVIGNIQADIYHLHDWYGAVVLDHLFRQGHRAILSTSHLPLRRGFTYRDSGLSWNSKSVLESRCFNALRYVTAPSEYVKGFLVEEYGLSANRIPVIPHGVNTAHFKFDGLQQAYTSTVKLLAVGRITDQKGFELLVRAMPTILAEEPTAILAIVGDGGAKSALVNLISDLNLESYVEVKPSMERNTLAAEYSSATLLVVPSQFEPFGLVGLEAMACGCPVLAIAPTGAEEYLESFELTPHYQIAELGHAILNRLQELRSSANPRDDARVRGEKFSWERAAASYASLYKKVMP